MTNEERFHEVGDKLYKIVSQYLKDHRQYPTDVVLGINWDTKDIIIESPSKMDASFEQFSLAEFIGIDEQGFFEPRLF
ncbi:MAG: hypothetical protein K6A41_06335 [Bacteroidales bacterium]|nr:hypothetical protein [Bacteroidales bacterium]